MGDTGGIHRGGYPRKPPDQNPPRTPQAQPTGPKTPPSLTDGQYPREKQRIDYAKGSLRVPKYTLDLGILGYP